MWKEEEEARVEVAVEWIYEGRRWRKKIGVRGRME